MAPYHLLKQIQDNPRITQRELAKKAAYLYKLTPKGIEEKARVTDRFLHRKMEEYERLKTEIEELRQEVGDEE